MSFPSGHIPGFHIPGTLAPIGAIMAQQAANASAVAATVAALTDARFSCSPSAPVVRCQSKGRSGGVTYATLVFGRVKLVVKNTSTGKY
jgi:hypothetical protein